MPGVRGAGRRERCLCALLARCQGPGGEYVRSGLRRSWTSHLRGEGRSSPGPSVSCGCRDLPVKGFKGHTVSHDPLTCTDSRETFSKQVEGACCGPVRLTCGCGRGHFCHPHLPQSIRVLFQLCEPFRNINAILSWWATHGSESADCFPFWVGLIPAGDGDDGWCLPRTRPQALRDSPCGAGLVSSHSAETPRTVSRKNPPG